MAGGEPEIPRRDCIGPQAIGDQYFGRDTLPLEQLPYQSESRRLVALGMDQHV
jgi:hypothetical protein